MGEWWGRATGTKAVRDLVGGLVPAEGGGLWAVIFNRVAQARRIASAGRMPWVPCEKAGGHGGPAPAEGRGSAPAFTATLTVVPRARASAG